jgi:hypothetical protein
MKLVSSLLVTDHLPLPPPPMMIFPVGIELPNVVTIQRPHDSDPGEHRRTAKFCDQEQRFHRGLPWRCVVFRLRQLGNAFCRIP